MNIQIVYKPSIIASLQEGKYDKLLKDYYMNYLGDERLRLMFPGNLLIKFKTIGHVHLNKPIRGSGPLTAPYLTVNKHQHLFVKLILGLTK